MSGSSAPGNGESGGTLGGSSAALPPLMLDIDDPRLRGAGAVLAKPGDTIVLVVPDGTEAQWAATVHSPDVARFVAGGDQGTWVARPGFAVLAMGGATIDISGPGGADLVLNLQVTADGAPQPGQSQPPTVPEPDASAEAVVAQLVGMTEAAATTAAEGAGLTVRVIGRDGESFAVTMDYRTDRVNLRVADGRVAEATIG